MSNELTIFINPTYYFIYPPAGVIPLGLVLALITVCYFIGTRKLRTAYWVPIVIVVVAVLLYIVFRLTIPFPTLIPPENIRF